MRQQKRWVHFLLLFVFGFLSLKNLLPDAMDGEHLNCAEFGHIHWYKMNPKLAPGKALTQASQRTEGDDENCHSGKMLSTCVPLPRAGYDIERPSFETVFDLIADLKDNSPNPDLEPRRKPPRAS